MKIRGIDRIFSNHQSSAREQTLPAENFFFMLTAFQGMLCISVAFASLNTESATKWLFILKLFILQNPLIQTLTNIATKCVCYSTHIFINFWSKTNKSLGLLGLLPVTHFSLTVHMRLVWYLNMLSWCQGLAAFSNFLWVSNMLHISVHKVY